MMEDRNGNPIRIFQTWKEDRFGNMRLYTIHENENGNKWRRKLDGPMTKKEYFKRKLAGKI